MFIEGALNMGKKILEKRTRDRQNRQGKDEGEME